MMHIDLRQHALNLLKLSKKFLSEDGDLDATAFIITADDQLLRPIDLQEESRKLESCKKIVEEARQQHAIAIVTIFLARFKDFDHEDFVAEAYSWGDIQDGSSERCVLVTVSGPGVKNWAAAVPFRLASGRIVFRDRVEFTDGVDLGLFPGWADQIGKPRVI